MIWLKLQVFFHTRIRTQMSFGWHTFTSTLCNVELALALGDIASHSPNTISYGIIRKRFSNASRTHVAQSTLFVMGMRSGTTTDAKKDVHRRMCATIFRSGVRKAFKLLKFCTKWMCGFACTSPWHPTAHNSTWTETISTYTRATRVRSYDIMVWAVN